MNLLDAVAAETGSSVAVDDVVAALAVDGGGAAVHVAVDVVVAENECCPIG